MENRSFAHPVFCAQEPDASAISAPPFACGAASSASGIITSLTRHDILMGRGAPLAYYQGNVWFRDDVIAPWKEAYTASKSQLQKQTIALHLYIEIGKRNGRFLAKLPASSSSSSRTVATAKSTAAQWVIVDETVALEKIKQALREKSHVPSDSTDYDSSIVPGTAYNEGDAVAGKSVLQEKQRQTKRQRPECQLIRSVVASIASALPQSSDSNFVGVVLGQQQPQRQQPALAGPTRVANDPSVTVASTVNGSQPRRSVEVLRQHLNRSEPQTNVMSLQPPPLPPQPQTTQTTPTATTPASLSMSTMSALAALLLPRAAPPPPPLHDSVVENMLIRQRKQRLELEMLQQWQQQQQLTWQLEQRQRQQHVDASNLFSTGSTLLPPNSNPFLAASSGHLTDSSFHSSLWQPPSVLLNRAAAEPEAEGTTAAPNRHIAVSGLPPLHALTGASGSHSSNHSPSRSTTNNEDEDCKPRARKQARP